ncbi:LytS/YhcK type 5TM receptor domain-containing protein [Clostridium senegalense]|uniref:LytS/YhcK type 5TM receptor domain-containing protein n=2 Tax=Clostridium senegalense TaxID=1465809 RepID=UPI00028A1587|nr:LytS/YhcK type 5TM receptor domain-containing protein [Clostridium senegalense]
MWTLTNTLMSNLGYVILIAFTISKSKTFKKALDNSKYTIKDIVILSAIFSGLGIVGTYFGVDYYGAIVNIRNVGIIVASIVCGPLVGGIAGIVASFHRIISGVGATTAIPCAISTIVAGIMPGYLYKLVNTNGKYVFGCFCAVVIESFSMILIRIMVPTGSEIISSIYIPMVVINGLGVVLVIGIIDNIFKEKEKVAGEQAKLALEIANKTLPYFKDLSEASLEKVCEIIRVGVGGEVAIITGKEHILAYSSKNNKLNIKSKEIVGEYTKRAISTGETVIISDKEEEIGYNCIDGIEIKSGIITPLNYDKEVIGILKVYFNKNSKVTEGKKYLILGLSNLISTQIQLGNIKKLEDMAKKAEIKALQAQINPHFLFNALNTITSFIRINPSKARELIINLSNYLRYNIEFKENLVELDEEMEHVKAYVYIEKCRFGDKIQVHYDIDEEARKARVPTLIIQPLVENAIKHGILEDVFGKNVWIEVKKVHNGFKVIIEDDGCGIDNNIVDQIYNDKVDENKIGLYNVHSRVKLIYGKGLEIERLEKGTRISFIIN